MGGAVKYISPVAEKSKRDPSAALRPQDADLCQVVTFSTTSVRSSDGCCPPEKESASSRIRSERPSDDKPGFSLTNFATRAAPKNSPARFCASPTPSE